MNLTTLLYDVADGVATITLNRPDSRNAVNRAMCEDLVAACAAASADDNVRLVLVRANGPVFCAGADLKERKDMSADEIRARRLRGVRRLWRGGRLPMPAVAVVHGPAVGSGCEIAACCDFVVGDAARRCSSRPKRCGEPSARRSGCRAFSASGWRRT